MRLKQQSGAWHYPYFSNTHYNTLQYASFQIENVIYFFWLIAIMK